MAHSQDPRPHYHQRLHLLRLFEHQFQYPPWKIPTVVQSSVLCGIEMGGINVMPPDGRLLPGDDDISQRLLLCGEDVAVVAHGVLPTVNAISVTTRGEEQRQSESELRNEIATLWRSSRILTACLFFSCVYFIVGVIGALVRVFLAMTARPLQTSNPTISPSPTASTIAPPRRWTKMK